MTHDEEILALRDRALDSLQAARELLGNRHFNVAASRAYYAAFYAFSALFVKDGLKFRKHGGVIAAVHSRLVHTGTIPKEDGQAMQMLFDLRSAGDYGAALSVEPAAAAEAVAIADRLTHLALDLLEKG